MLNALSALFLTAVTTSSMAYDQGEAERKIQEMLTGKPVPNELKNPNLTPAEIQRKQFEIQQADQQKRENLELAKQNRIKLLHDISYNAFSTLKNEGVLFDNVRSKVNDIVEINASEDFAVGKELVFSFYENPSYFCPKGADCIRINSMTNTFGGDCKFSIFGSPYVPGTLPGFNRIGEWKCHEFLGDAVKSQGVEGVRQYAINQMRKGASGPATGLSKQMNNEAEKFFQDIFSNLPK